MDLGLNWDGHDVVSWGNYSFVLECLLEGYCTLCPKNFKSLDKLCPLTS